MAENGATAEASSSAATEQPEDKEKAPVESQEKDQETETAGQADNEPEGEQQEQGNGGPEDVGREERVENAPGEGEGQPEGEQPSKEDAGQQEQQGEAGEEPIVGETAPGEGEEVDKKEQEKSDQAEQEGGEVAQQEGGEVVQQESGEVVAQEEERSGAEVVAEGEEGGGTEVVAEEEEGGGAEGSVEQRTEVNFDITAESPAMEGGHEEQVLKATGSGVAFEDDQSAVERSLLQSPSKLSVQPTPLEDIVEEEEIDREAVIEQLKEALAEQERLHSANAQLQHKIAEYLARKKTEERPDPSRSVTDQEKRYDQCMGALEQLQEELQAKQRSTEWQEQELKGHRDDRLEQVQEAAASLKAYQKERALTAVHSRSGKKLTSQELDQYQAAQDKKEVEVTQVRLENIKLQNKIQKQEALIKQKEQLAEGLHMIDFEQLKITNVDLNEKIEERNEEIMKLKKKVTATVQVLTHVKEKLQFLQAENSGKRTKLQGIEAVVGKERDHLTRMKQARDALRIDNIRLRQKGGLVCHSALLRDFEERRDQSEELRAKLESLQQRHSELTVLCDGLRKKIEQTRTMQPHM